MTGWEERSNPQDLIYMTIVAAPWIVTAACEAAHRTQKVAYSSVPEPMPGNAALTKVKLILHAN